ncbi:MAG: protein-glutamate O-methyltransferase CheR [Nitrospirae bacterium]|nr:MAG: protein-glutamate O-methyltransferase CheR [Nitrospirota bacterium]
MPTLTAKRDYSIVRSLVRERAAIVLEPGKDYLIESRLDSVVRELGLSSIDDLLSRLRGTRYSVLHEKVVEVMTTNETSFFRDRIPFEIFANVLLPDVLARRDRDRVLSLWCGACSSGQEPYTIAILLRERFPELRHWRIRFFATDISPSMIARCRQGCYSEMEVRRGMPETLLTKYFRRCGTQWEVVDELKMMVTFQTMNLIGTWLSFPRLDFVFLRNVLIYFDLETKKMILRKVRSQLAPDGYLILGGTETIGNLDDGFERLDYRGISCYRVRT